MAETSDIPIPEFDAATSSEKFDSWQLAVPVLYADVKRLAGMLRARSPGNATLQTTALVHEAYLRLRSAPGLQR